MRCASSLQERRATARLCTLGRTTAHASRTSFATQCVRVCLARFSCAEFLHQYAPAYCSDNLAIVSILSHTRILA